MILHFTFDQQANPMLIRMGGRLTLGPHLLNFGRQVADLLTKRTPTGLLLDVAGIEEIDSAGLGELVILYTTASQRGCRLCLVRPTPRVTQLLETTKLSGILPHFDDSATAEAWAGSPQ